MQYKPHDAVRDTKKGVLIDVHVISQSKETQIKFNEWEPRIKVKVRSPPHKGRANVEVKELFRQMLGRCEIISGSLSPKKTLLIEDCTTQEVMKKMGKPLTKHLNKKNT